MLRKLILSLLAIGFIGAAGLVGFLYLAPEAFTQTVLKAGRSYAGLERKEITLADGLHYVYLEGGKGEPLLLLHGFGANKDNFVAVASYLVKHYHLIIPDLAGFGESSKPLEADYSPDAQVDRLHALLTAIGIQGKVHVGGNSMGGMITLRYGYRYPSETASMWLLDPAGIFSAPETEIMTAALHSPNNPLQVRNADDMKALVAKATAKPIFIPQPMLEVLAREQIANKAVQDKVFAEILKSDTEKRIAGSLIPSLIVWGDRDQLVHPAGAEILHKLLPNSSVVMMPEVGHVPMMEVPAKTAADYLRFRESLASAGAS